MRISSLRPPLSGCDFAGELLLGERSLVQVQMQVLVMLQPQVLRALLQCQVLLLELLGSMKRKAFFWIFCRKRNV